MAVFAVVFGGFVSASAQYGSAAAPKKQEREHFDPKRDPAKDLKEAVAKVTKKNMRILLDVGGEWCPWCKLMDQYFIDNKKVGGYLRANFIVVKVNFSQENQNEKFLSAYPTIDSYPRLLVLEKDGTFLDAQDTGELEQGHGYSDEKMMAFLKKWTMPKAR
jgi:thioredoxin-related protein